MSTSSLGTSSTKAFVSVASRR